MRYYAYILYYCTLLYPTVCCIIAANSIAFYSSSSSSSSYFSKFEFKFELFNLNFSSWPKISNFRVLADKNTKSTVDLIALFLYTCYFFSSPQHNK